MHKKTSLFSPTNRIAMRVIPATLLAAGMLNIANAAIVTLTPTDDAHIRDDSNAAKNYGGDILLAVKTGSAAGIRWSAYLKFNRDFPLGFEMMRDALFESVLT